MSSDGFAKKIKNGVSACFYEIILPLILPVTLFKRSLFRLSGIPTCEFQNCRRAACDSENFSESGLLKNSTIDSEGMPEHKF
jgi:hypothetical protein